MPVFVVVLSRQQPEHSQLFESVAAVTRAVAEVGADPSDQAIAMGGESCDILRRQPGGRWLIAIDNPWGAQILERNDKAA